MEAGAAYGELALVPVRGEINPATANYLKRALARAADNRAVAAILMIDTPGGFDASMREMVQAIDASTVPVVGYVVPGGRAASAGAFVMMATHVAAMAPGTAIGAATPVAAGGADLGDTLKRKATEDAEAYMRGLAQKHGRNATPTEEMVTQAKSVTASEAFDQNVIDLVALDREALAQALNGRVVKLSTGREVTIDTTGAAFREIGMTLGERFMAVITDPNIAFILLSLAGIALFFEFSNPGAIFPGVSGAILLLLALLALGSLEANWVDVLLILPAFASLYWRCSSSATVCLAVAA